MGKPFYPIGYLIKKFLVTKTCLISVLQKSMGISFLTYKMLIPNFTGMLNPWNSVRHTEIYSTCPFLFQATVRSLAQLQVVV